MFSERKGRREGCFPSRAKVWEPFSSRADEAGCCRPLQGCPAHAEHGRQARAVPELPELPEPRATGGAARGREGTHGAGQGLAAEKCSSGAPAAQGGRYQGLVTLEHRCVLSISAGHAGPAPTAPKSKEHVRIPVVYGVTGEWPSHRKILNINYSIFCNFII